MADIDEDAPITSLHAQSFDDNDPSDETQDFRLLAALSTKSGQLPKRGEKDFEPHGTKHQDGILEASRQAMHDALSYTRVHVPKGYIRGFYYGEEGLRRDDAIGEAWRRGLDEDHIVVVESSKGPHFRTMGKSSLGQKRPSLWLLPEEALYLVERGNLDLWWPTRSSFAAIVGDEEDEAEDSQGKLRSEDEDDEDEVDEGAPLSLQAAYSLFIGNDGERGKVSLDRYTVYANLKRNGYVVMRASPESESAQAPPVETNGLGVVTHRGHSNLVNWLLSWAFVASEVKHQPFGPLVRPGLYRSYHEIYRQIATIPRHKPSAVPANPATAAEDPYRVAFFLWKPTNVPNFAKTSPGPPDFRVAIADARASLVPSLAQITSLLESSPWDPPKGEWAGPGKIYQRLRHGWRNVVLAVVDQGVISYLRLGETAFGEERLWERFDDGGTRTGGNKRGGGNGRGRGGGGRGRGGRGGRGRR